VAKLGDGCFSYGDGWLGYRYTKLRFFLASILKFVIFLC
jgi:hypothetical protein